MSTIHTIRLSPTEVADLMRQDKIPKIYNQCVTRFQPLALVNGTYRCVSENIHDYCETCTMYPTRLSNTARGTYPVGPQRIVNTPTIDPIVEDSMEFRASLITIKDPDGSVRQCTFTFPMKVFREHHLEQGDELYFCAKKVRMP